MVTQEIQFETADGCLRRKELMTNAQGAGWSPADNPYAIAHSEAQWWKDAALLAISRMRRNDERRIGPSSSQQIDARQLVFALRQLLSAEELEQFALRELGIDQAIRASLSQARQRFEEVLPGIKDMRDGLMHFEEWARGMGRGPQKKQRNDGALPRDVARHFWGFGFDPKDGVVSFGPYRIAIDAAERATRELALAIWLAAREVDKRNTAELRTRTVAALDMAGIAEGSPDAGFKVSPGHDLTICLSLDRAPGMGYHTDSELAQRIVAALAEGGLRLVSSADPEDRDTAARLARGEPLYVEVDAPA